MSDAGVTDVEGRERDGWLHLSWMGAEGLRFSAFDAEQLAALGVYLAQPKPPTPQELAEEIVDDWLRAHQMEYLKARGILSDNPPMADLIARIAGTLAAMERERGEGQ